jgi:hypothetical protein
MTFRVEDLTVSLLPEPYEVEGMADCTKCTKCTAKTGDLTCCAAPTDNNCTPSVCVETGEDKPKRKTMREDDLAVLSAQLDEALAAARN